MATTTLVEAGKLSADAREAFSRALGVVASKVGISEEDVTRRLHARDRMTWSRFRFEIAREVSTILGRHLQQVRGVYLWELDEEVPEAPDAPAEPTLDLILRVDRIPGDLDDLAVEIGKELAHGLDRRAPGTPLVLTVHPLTKTMMSSGRGMAALFRSPHQHPALIWSSAE